ncbi:unnamed protein product [Darwinula stevensoni]|uniref:Methyltransferase FkbM domain-containing protein n=1 Tax=Darwinula stevensoni TaxID=69355 RepID=A0A7R9ABD0_9CRUS|nr:unnamed protein product [Darwinula stevensoni]CAG0898853.1 unnamed protein product [Darwinula stevensoni]
MILACSHVFDCCRLAMRRNALVFVLVGLALTITLLSFDEVRRAPSGGLSSFEVTARPARVSFAGPENAPTAGDGDVKNLPSAGDWNEKTLPPALSHGEKIAGNDTRLVTHLRQSVLHHSNSDGHPYPFDSGPKGEHFTQSKEESRLLQDLFSNITRGFFIEAGAFNGFVYSNTLWLELERNWTGLLIEPTKSAYNSLESLQRKAWIAHSCLSDAPHPKKVIVEDRTMWTDLRRNATNVTGEDLICYPLETFLIALDVKTVDFFSLDVEGMDYGVLATIPFHIFRFEVLMVETDKGNREEILALMASKNYTHFMTTGPEDIFVPNDAKYIKLRNETDPLKSLPIDLREVANQSTRFP